MYISMLVGVESERTNVVEDCDGGMYFRRLGHDRNFHCLHISSIPASELSAFGNVRNPSKSQHGCFAIFW